MGFHIEGRSQAGPRRVENQDRWGAGPGWMVVCDGVGGHAGGAIAAQAAVDAVGARLDAGPVRSVRAAERRLRDAVEAAHDAVRAGRAADPALADMASTLTGAIAVRGRRWVIAQVGDSPAWRVGPDRARAITWDHNLVGELVRAGALRPDQAIGHRGRHIVTRALGATPTVEPELFTVDLAADEALVLASDGLSDVAGPDDVIGTVDPDALVLLAQGRGSMDDVTVVVAR
jgi:protein phosphatase